ncbi:MAG: PKD domain-containing protein [Bacteroidota bacterium]
MKPFSIKYAFFRVKPVLYVLPFLLAFGCDKPPVMPDPDPFKPTASFFFSVDTLTANFTDQSINGNTYLWEFGDGNTSDEQNPAHTYQDEGTYSVKLTITSVSDLQATATETVEVTKPEPISTEVTPMEILAGKDGAGKAWILQRQEIAFGVGPAPLDVQWFALGVQDPLSTSPCTLDDEYIFKPDGAFILDSKGTITLDQEQFGGWNDSISGGCNDESTPGLFTSSAGVDVSAFANGGDYSFTLEDEVLTLNGAGVYIANPAKNNVGELGPNSSPPETWFADVIKLVDYEDVDSMTLVMPVNGGGAFWTFWLVHYDDESLKPDIPE